MSPKPAQPDSAQLARMHHIASLIPQGARVLDLGCGTGEVLAHLTQHHGCTGYGIEIDDANVLASIGLIEKYQYNDASISKPAYRYIGPSVDVLRNAECNYKLKTLYSH